MVKERTSSVMIERFTAFYTWRPFWAGDVINFDAADAISRFTEQMSEIVFSYDYEQFSSSDLQRRHGDASRT